MSKLYAVYDENDFPVCVGTSRECADYMGKKSALTFIQHCVRVRNGTISPKLRGYVIGDDPQREVKNSERK